MSTNVSSIPKIPELNKKLLFTAFMLVCYRLGVFVPIPGIDPEQISRLFEQTSGTIFDILNMFSGGALEQASIFALGVMPYITASIIMSLLVKAFPSLEAMQKRGRQEEGRLTSIQGTGLSLSVSSRDLCLLLHWKAADLARPE